MDRRAISRRDAMLTGGALVAGLAELPDVMTSKITSASSPAFWPTVRTSANDAIVPAIYGPSADEGKFE